MMTIHIVLLILVAGFRVVAQGAPDPLDEARKETERRVLEDAAVTIDPELLSGAEPRMVEAYRVGEDGFYVPASAEEYYRATRHLHAVAPIAPVVTGAIDDATKKPGKEGPPEKVLPAAGPGGRAP